MRTFYKELRIGNWIQIDGAIYEVTALQEHAVSCGNLIKPAKGMRTNGGQKSGIYLTPEILVSAGFTTKENRTQIDGIEMTLRISGEGRDGTWFSTCGTMAGGIVVLCLCRGNYFRSNIEFLHDLQNTFYFLTGKELNINL